MDYVVCGLLLLGSMAKREPKEMCINDVTMAKLWVSFECLVIGSSMAVKFASAPNRVAEALP